MSALAKECGAINLSQGFPDFPVDARLGDLLKEANSRGFDQYAPMPGLPLLHDSITDYFRRRFHIDINASQELTITPGATYAIYVALAALIRPGDEVIVLEPAYDSYIPNIRDRGGIPVTVPLSVPDFKTDWQRLADAITGKTRVIIINTPHNPAGTVWEKEDFDLLAGIIGDRDISVVSDEVYEQLVFDGRKHQSILHHPQLKEKSCAVFSFGKVFQNTGWKIGYCIAPAGLTASIRNYHQYLAFTVNTPAQYALARYLDENQELNMAPLLQSKRDFFLDKMQDSGFDFLSPAAGSFFQLASIKSLTAMPDIDFAKWLTRELGVATIPVSYFYQERTDHQLLRFCFAKKESTLQAAAGQLTGLKEKI